MSSHSNRSRSRTNSSISQNKYQQANTEFQYIISTKSNMQYILHFLPEALIRYVTYPIFYLILAFVIYTGSDAIYASTLITAEPFFWLIGEGFILALFRSCRNLYNERITVGQVGAARLLISYSLAVFIGLACAIGIACAALNSFIMKALLIQDDDNTKTYFISLSFASPVFFGITVSYHEMLNRIQHKLGMNTAVRIAMYAFVVLTTTLLLFIFNAFNLTTFKSGESVILFVGVILTVVYILMFLFYMVFQVVDKEQPLRVKKSDFVPFQKKALGQVFLNLTSKILSSLSTPIVSVIFLAALKQMNKSSKTNNQLVILQLSFSVYRYVFQVACIINQSVYDFYTEYFLITHQMNKNLKLVLSTLPIMFIAILLYDIFLYIIFDLIVEKLFNKDNDFYKQKNYEIHEFLYLFRDVKKAPFLSIAQLFVSLSNSFIDGLKLKKLGYVTESMYFIAIVVFSVIAFIKDAQDLQFLFMLFQVTCGIWGLLSSILVFKLLKEKTHKTENPFAAAVAKELNVATAAGKEVGNALDDFDDLDFNLDLGEGDANIDVMGDAPVLEQLDSDLCEEDPEELDVKNHIIHDEINIDEANLKLEEQRDDIENFFQMTTDTPQLNVQTQNIISQIDEIKVSVSIGHEEILSSSAILVQKNAISGEKIKLSCDEFQQLSQNQDQKPKFDSSDKQTSQMLGIEEDNASV